MGGRKAVQAALATLLLAASAAACSPSDADRGTAAPNTVATEPPPTTTTNPYAVPPVIDEAYVNRVLAGLDAVMGDVLRLVIQTRTIPPAAYNQMRAVYADPDRLQREVDGLQRDIRSNFADYKIEPGNTVTVTRQLITVRRDCIFARVNRDYSAVGANPLPTVSDQWIGLRRVQPSLDPNNLNPTPWALVYDGFQSDRSQPPNPCAN